MADSQIHVALAGNPNCGKTCLLYTSGDRKAVDRQCGELFAQVLLAGAQVEQGRDGHIAADARGAVDDKRVPVSYTHLDVYKRQVPALPTKPSTSRACPPPTSPLPWHFVRSSI